MIYSKATEYALKALVYLAGQPEGKQCGVSEIAQTLNIPQHFLGKILQDLRKYEFVTSTRGRYGGFQLAKSPEQIGVYDIVESLEEIQKYEMCIFDEFECTRDRPCAVICDWNGVKSQISQFLKQHSIADLLTVQQYRVKNQL